MKKFDLVAKKQELESRRVRDTKETTGTRLTKVFAGSIGAFMLWSAFSTVSMPNSARIVVNALLLIGLGLYLWKSGAFRKNKA